MLAQAATRKLDSQYGIAPGLAFAFRRLHRADVRIADVACEIGMSRERFSKTFRREFGLSPKSFARIRRFARTLAVGRQDPSLTRRIPRRSMRVCRSSAHDPRLPRIFRQRPLGVVAAGSCQTPAVSSTEPGVTFLQDRDQETRLGLRGQQTSRRSHVDHPETARRSSPISSIATLARRSIFSPAPSASRRRCAWARRAAACTERPRSKANS